jgi:hypothetical protein
LKNWEKLEKEVRERLFKFINKNGTAEGYTYPRLIGGRQCHTADRREGVKEKKRANNQYSQLYVANSLFKYIKPFVKSTPHAMLVQECNIVK